MLEASGFTLTAREVAHILVDTITPTDSPIGMNAASLFYHPVVNDFFLSLFFFFFVLVLFIRVSFGVDGESFDNFESLKIFLWEHVLCFWYF